MRLLQKNRSEAAFEYFRADSCNLSEAFDRILSLSNNQHRKLDFAPFGPKTHSAAMCLYAIATDSRCAYSQPMIYNPDYSTGIRQSAGKIAAYCYLVKSNGTNLYSI